MHANIIVEEGKSTLRLGKRTLRAVLLRAGYDIVRVAKPRPTPRVQFSCTDLSEYRRTTNSIPGMISPEAAELLYGIAVVQNIEGDILEIGSWQGKSTSYLARAVMDSKNGHVFAVDHFMGNVRKESIYFVDGGGSANLQVQFERNMHTLNLHDYITLFPCHSEKAYPSLANKVLRLLFVDGDHTYEGAKKDIELFCPLVRIGGVVIFDDFNNTSPGVVLAAEQWVKTQCPRTAFVNGNMLVCKI